MDRTKPTAPARRPGRIRAIPIALFLLILVSGPALAACSDAHQPASSDGGWGAMPTMAARVPTIDATPAGRVPADMPMPGAEVAWAARPAYVRSNPATEEAYAFALAHPQIVRWMPCYCGCDAMDHRSNLDCYFKRGQPGDRATFEEHASFCDICVQITLKTKELDAQGRSLHEIRLIIDQTFGGTVPGTLTGQPPI